MMRNLTDFMKDLSTRANERTVQRLAENCKTGDAAAMYKMAYMMLSRCSPEEIKLLELYETEPSQEHEENICVRKKLELNGKSLYDVADSSCFVRLCGCSRIA